MEAKQPEDWERLPDERVVIDVFNERLAVVLNKKTIYEARFLFSSLLENKERLNKGKGIPYDMSSLRLGDLMTYNKLVKSMSNEKNGYIKVLLSGMYGSFLHSDFDPNPSMNSGYQIDIYPKPQDVEPTQNNTCPSGIEPHISGFILEHQSRKKRVYCLLAEHRKFSATRPLRVECKPRGYSWKRPFCTLQDYWNKRRTWKATFPFWAVGIEPSSDNLYGVSIKDWTKLDQQAQTLLHHIFIDEVEGAIQ